MNFQEIAKNAQEKFRNQTIEKISETDYPRFNEHFDAYFAKDENGNIVGIYVGSDYDMITHIFDYFFWFSLPAKEVKFLMREIICQPKDTNFPDKMIEVWGFTFETGKFLLIQELGSIELHSTGYHILNYSKLIF